MRRHEIATPVMHDDMADDQAQFFQATSQRT